MSPCVFTFQSVIIYYHPAPYNPGQRGEDPEARTTPLRAYEGYRVRATGSLRQVVR